MSGFGFRATACVLMHRSCCTAAHVLVCSIAWWALDRVAWERLAELEKASTKKAVTGETAVLVKQNESLAQTNKELMARLKVLERSQYHSSIRLAKLESDLRESESVRDDLESKILNAERVCTALANVAISKEKTAIETTVSHSSTHS